MTHRLTQTLGIIAVVFAMIAGAPAQDGEGWTWLFNGQDLPAWEGDMDLFRVDQGAIVAGTLERPIARNEFLCTKKSYGDFELTLEAKLTPEGGNAGIQFRSMRDAESSQVVRGYQADMGVSGGGNVWGSLYDEARRMRFLAESDPEALAEVFKPGEWNDYRIRAAGPRIQLWINGLPTVDYVESDPEIARAGVIGLQIHGGGPAEARYRNVKIREIENAPAEVKNVVFLAGTRSHGWDSHEHNAGCLLLAKAINENVPGVRATVHLNGWPEDSSIFEGADAVVIYCDGGDGHMLNKNLAEFDALMDAGVGLGCLHYAVEVPAGESGNHFLKWIGGYFEAHWSVNPHWTAEFKQLPAHPITRGVNPFAINDEWYYHMRFRPGMEGVTPILTAMPSDETLSRADGPHSGNPHVREAVARGEAQHVAWAAERPGGGRGFGFTGGHFHHNWADDDFRKLVLNAVVWLAGAEPPAGGVGSKTPTTEELEANQDYDKPQPKRR